MADDNMIVFEPRSQDGCLRISEGGVIPTLNTAQGGQRQPCVCFESHDQDARYREMGDVCETVSAKHGTGGGNAPMVVSIGNGQMCNMSMSEVGNTLDCMHDQQAIMIDDTANSGSPKYVVRRLTPLECERLQGFPDGYTDIGDWVDSKGKKRKCSDSARYKALGNSIAIPPWLWVLFRLNKYCEDKTMASLFDGMGGFPLIWSFLNGKENCVWCSEIDEFANAVSQRHFPDDT